MNRIRPLTLSVSVCLGMGLLLVAPKILAQQVTTGQILGSVTDSSGAVIPGAKVTITNTATGIAKTTVTNSSGSYFVPYLIPGTYVVGASKLGFERITKTGITLQVEQKAVVDVTLPVGSTTQTVAVARLH